MKALNKLQSRLAKARAQKGFTLIELGIVIVILTVLAALAIPAIRTEIIKGRVASTADDITKAVVGLKNLAGLDTSGAPFAGFTQVQLGALFRNSNQKVISATGQINHSVGGPTGQITGAALNTNTQYQLTITNINEVACVNLATALSKSADSLAINPAGGAAPAATTADGYGTPGAGTPSVKGIGTPYNATLAAARCGPAETNSIYVLVNSA